MRSQDSMRCTLADAPSARALSRENFWASKASNAETAVSYTTEWPLTATALAIQAESMVFPRPVPPRKRRFGESEPKSCA